MKGSNTEAGARSLPTVVLVGGRLVLEDGSEIDTRQPVQGAAMIRAVRDALVSTPEWWSTVVSVVIPTLDDAEGGFAFTEQRTITRITEGGRVRRTRFPRYPRRSGEEDYIYSPRTVQERLKRLEKARRRLNVGSASIARDDESRWQPRIRISTSAAVIRDVDSYAHRTPKMLVLPDTVAIREAVQVLIDPRQPQEVEEADESVWTDRHRYLRLVGKAAECAVTGLVLNGRWEDPAGLEAARRLLLERYDLRIGLWDLVLNPVLRDTALDRRTVAPAPKAPATAPSAARRRAEQQGGGVCRALHTVLGCYGWTLPHFGLQHAIAKITPNRNYGQPNYPYLRATVRHHDVRVLVWHWHYTTYDINGFVDRRRAEFDEIAVLPSRKPLRASEAQTLAKFRKSGEVVYDPGRFIDDTRSVTLWSTNCGWRDIDVDWTPIAQEIADRTSGWVRLLAESAAECLGIDRQHLILVDGS